VQCLADAFGLDFSVAAGQRYDARRNVVHQSAADDNSQRSSLLWPTGQTFQKVECRLLTDVAGYSRLMGTEEGTLARLKAVRKALVDPTIASRRGRIVKTTGDGMKPLIFIALVVIAVADVAGAQGGR